MQNSEARAIALRSIQIVNSIFEQDSTALLSSTLPHKGSVGDANAAYLALISEILINAQQ